VAAYCSAVLPCSRSTLSVARSTSAKGNTSGAGSPPAKEMTSGFSVSLSSSRMTELVIRCVRWAKRSLQSVGTAVPFPFASSGETAFRASISSAGIGMTNPPRKPCGRNRLSRL
jgi:hypothetical protein